MLFDMTSAIHNYRVRKGTHFYLLSEFARIYEFKSYTKLHDNFVKQMDELDPTKYINTNDILRIVVNNYISHIDNKTSQFYAELSILKEKNFLNIVHLINKYDIDKIKSTDHVLRALWFDMLNIRDYCKTGQFVTFANREMDISLTPRDYLKEYGDRIFSSKKHQRMYYNKMYTVDFSGSAEEDYEEYESETDDSDDDFSDYFSDRDEDEDDDDDDDEDDDNDNKKNSIPPMYSKKFKKEFIEHRQVLVDEIVENVDLFINTAITVGAKKVVAYLIMEIVGRTVNGRTTAHIVKTITDNIPGYDWTDRPFMHYYYTYVGIKFNELCETNKYSTDEMVYEYWNIQYKYNIMYDKIEYDDGYKWHTNRELDGDYSYDIAEKPNFLGYVKHWTILQKYDHLKQSAIIRKLDEKYNIINEKVTKTMASI